MGAAWIGMVWMLGAAAPSSTSVDLVPFVGDSPARELQASVDFRLGEAGLEVHVVTPATPDGPREAPAAPDDPRHLEQLHRDWLAGDPQARFLVVGSTVEHGEDRHYRIHVFDGDQTLATLHAHAGQGELILPIVLPMAAARAVDERLHPPSPPTEDERVALATLDDPPWTEPEIDPCIVGCCYRPEWPASPPTDIHDLRVDLRDDFDEYCRVEPARRRWSSHDPVDLRPVCRRGPRLGYVRPRTWVTGAATLAAGAATGVAFGLRSAGWSHGGMVVGDHRVGATMTTWGATSAAATGALLSATIGLVITDRRRARQFIRREKALRLLE